MAACVKIDGDAGDDAVWVANNRGVGESGEAASVGVGEGDEIKVGTVLEATDVVATSILPEFCSLKQVAVKIIRMSAANKQISRFNMAFPLVKVFL